MIQSDKTQMREHWGGNLGFILAAAGSAIGLGNIWKFPYITGENGGGAFVLIYLFCIALIGLPIMICEITIGRAAQKNPYGAIRSLTGGKSSSISGLGIMLLLLGLGLLCFTKFGLAAVFILLGATFMAQGWATIGIMSVLTPFFIMATYGVVGGWTLAYCFMGITQQLNFSSPDAAAQAKIAFNHFSTHPYWPVICQAVFMTSCAYVVWGGVRRGIEVANKILMPVLFFIILVLIMRGVTLDNASAGIRFFLTPHFERLTTEAVLIALGHAFFSLSLGMGAMVTYGSYLDSSKNIFTSSLTIVALDTIIALLAGLAIFPAVFAMNMNPCSGPGLVFQIMPLTFNAIGDGLGWLWCSIFFLLLTIAAITSCISMLEVCVSFCMDELKWSRHKTVFICTSLIILIGTLCALSVSNWERFPNMEKWFIYLFGSARGSLFDMLDYLTCNFMLPLGGLLFRCMSGGDGELVMP